MRHGWPGWLEAARAELIDSSCFGVAICRDAVPYYVADGLVLLRLMLRALAGKALGRKPLER